MGAMAPYFANIIALLTDPGRSLAGEGCLRGGGRGMTEMVACVSQAGGRCVVPGLDIGAVGLYWDFAMLVQCMEEAFWALFPSFCSIMDYSSARGQRLSVLIRTAS